MYKFIEKWSDFILNETLTTHDIHLTYFNVKNELSLMRYNFNININPNNSISIKLIGFRYLQGIGLYLDNLNSLLIDRHGWFPSKMEITNFSGMTNLLPYNEEILRDKDKYIYYQDVEIIYESKYDIEIKSPLKLYHLSIQEYENKVLIKGLFPKSKSKLSNHLDRIYVCSNINDCYNLIPQIKSLYKELKINNKRNKINDKWIIYEIDFSELDIKLYKDPNYIGGYYIVDNIPSDKIKIIDKE